MADQNKPVIRGDISRGFVLFRLGDPERGWIPSRQQIDDFAALLDELEFKTPAIVYHCFVTVESHRDDVRVITLGDSERDWCPSLDTFQSFLREVDEHAQPGTIVTTLIRLGRLPKKEGVPS